MNYRHHFHAGNFADVMKHALLVQLLRALQQKEKGLLYLDTHAGRGSYDLTAASKGDSRVRESEWPNGIGRLWSQSDLPAILMEYVTLVRQFDHDRGNRDAIPRYYPGSPWIARLSARPQDRLALCEKHPEEFAALSEEFQFAPRTTVQAMDGYIALRAMLPPPERRALVLIDPAFEEQDEFFQLVSSLRDGLKRLPGGVFAVWYPLTERARIDPFFEGLIQLQAPPTLVLELTIAGEQSGMKMRGCGLAVINPPWKFDILAKPLLQSLAEILNQAAGADCRIYWLVPEK
jgi:23S rRNA (adenine2030-N6)-methyltransferase